MKLSSHVKVKILTVINCSIPDGCTAQFRTDAFENSNLTVFLEPDGCKFEPDGCYFSNTSLLPVICDILSQSDATYKIYIQVMECVEGMGEGVAVGWGVRGGDCGWGVGGNGGGGREEGGLHSRGH